MSDLLSTPEITIAGGPRGKIGKMICKLIREQVSKIQRKFMFFILIDFNQGRWNIQKVGGGGVGVDAFRAPSQAKTVCYCFDVSQQMLLHFYYS